MKMGWCVSILLLMLTVVQTVRSAPTIQAPWATIQGVSLEGDEGRKMNAYLAIPYALPPVGDRRFEKPEPHPGPGEGQVFVADQIMPPCPQMPILVGSARETSEDCLKLDVYTPVDADTTTRPRAVMVFIHGGGFAMGDAYLYRPSKLVVDGDVIVVAIQYRLGALGFLTSGDDVLPGNMALWDQNLALKWVQGNIRAFGGDPDRVTIFGESAGSVSVGLQMFSPESSGLFKRAILQSGSPQNVLYLSRVFDEKTIFKGLAGVFECQGEDSRQILQCLKQQSAADMLNKSIEFASGSPGQSYYFPRIDGQFIPDDLNKLVQDERFIGRNGIGDVDMMIGFNNKEGGVVLFMGSFANLSQESVYTSQFFGNMLDFCFMITGRKNNPVLKKAVEFFYWRAQAGSNTSETLDPVVDMFGDCLMNMPTIEWTRYLAQAPHNAGRYLYVVDHDFAFNDQGPISGAHHADELLMLFDTDREIPEDSIFAVLNKTSITAEEQPLSATFVQMWTTFAKTGNPSPPIQEALGEEWPEFTMEKEAYLSITMSPHVVTKLGPYRDRAALWSKHLPELADLTSQLPVEEPVKEKSESKDEL